MKDNYEFLTTATNGHILEITINRPDVMNSLHPPSHREFDEVWSEFTNDEDLWVAIITGAGDRACLLYTSPSQRDATLSRMPSSA